jgi:uncharacterized protein (TIGR02444 family)
MMQMLRSDLWDFAVSLYGKTGVSDACLSLQDEGGVDVPVLLFAAWLGWNSMPLSQGDLKRIVGDLGAWHDEVIIPLRQLRKRLKNGPKPAPGERTETLRTTIKAAELAAERIHLEALEEASAELPMTAEASSYDNMIVAVRYYQGGKIDDRAQSLTRSIADALPSR